MKHQVKSVGMKHINRLKVVLAEKQKTGKWLADQLGRDGAPILSNQPLKLSLK